jgi:hypothetical protein
MWLNNIIGMGVRIFPTTSKKLKGKRKNRGFGL